MPKILDLELSTPRFIGRIVVAALLAGMDFFVFNVLISPNDTFLASFLPSNIYNTLRNTLGSFVSPELPIIGILIATLIFVEQVFKGTRISGAFLVFTGALFSWYTYTFFQGGAMTFMIPSGLVPGITSGSATVHAYLLMWLFIAPSLLTILKGGLMFYTSNRKMQKEPFPELEPLTPIASAQYSVRDNQFVTQQGRAQTAS